MADVQFTGSTILDCERAWKTYSAARLSFTPAPIHKPQPQFLVFPTGQKTFHWRVVAVETNRTVSRHKNLRPALRKAEWLNQHRRVEQLGHCAFESPETTWGACDGGFRCPDLGVVHHLESERDLCYAHFLQAELQ